MSDSAKLRITSRKLGIEPVVSAFTLGIVIVGDVACAVNGIAEPEDMRLHNVIWYSEVRSRENRGVELFTSA